jgi:hypothetical protein
MCRYTMLVGKTPFQEKSVEGIYESVWTRYRRWGETADEISPASDSNIKGVNYTWPVNCKVSKPARDLIRAILTPDPSRSLQAKLLAIERTR